MERQAYKDFVIDQKKVVESTDVTFDDKNQPGLKEANDEDKNPLTFENIEDEDEDDETEIEFPTQQEPPEVPEIELSQQDTTVNEVTFIRGEIEETTGLDDEATSRPADQSRHERKWDRAHSADQIIGDPSAGVRTRRATQNECLYGCFLSQIEPKNVDEALLDPDWIVAMQE